MKKATWKTVMNLVLVVSVLFILIKVFFPVIQPFFESSKRTTAYEKFEIMDENITNIMNLNKQEVTNSISFEIDPGYAILAFQPNENSRNCGGETINKPDSCEKEACLCLFKIKNKGYKEVK